MKRSSALAVGIVAGTGALMASLVPSALCACIPADRTFSMAFGANPLRDDAARVRAAVLARLPPGKPRPEVERELDAQGLYHRHCKGSQPAIIDCEYDVSESRRLPWFESVRDGFSVRFGFDAQGGLVEATVARYRRAS